MNLSAIWKLLALIHALEGNVISWLNSELHHKVSHLKWVFNLVIPPPTTYPCTTPQPGHPSTHNSPTYNPPTWSSLHPQWSVVSLACRPTTMKFCMCIFQKELLSLQRTSWSRVLHFCVAPPVKIFTVEMASLFILLPFFSKSIIHAWWVV